MAHTTPKDQMGVGGKYLHGSRSQVPALFDELQAYDVLVAAEVHTATVDDYTTDVVALVDAAGGDPLYIDPGVAQDTPTVDDYLTQTTTTTDTAVGNPVLAAVQTLDFPFTQYTATITDEVQDGHGAIYAAPVDGHICRLECTFKGAAQVGPQTLATGDTLLVHYSAAPAGVVCLVTKTGIWAPHISLQDMYVRTTAGNYIKIQYDADAATNQAADPVWGDDDGAAVKLISDYTNNGQGAGNGAITTETDASTQKHARTQCPGGGLALLSADCQTSADALVPTDGSAAIPVTHSAGGGVGTPLYRRDADDVICINSPFACDSYVETTEGSLFKLTHDATAGGAGFTAITIDDNTPAFECNTGGATVDWTSSALNHGLAPKSVLTPVRSGGGDGIVVGMLNGTLTGAADAAVDIGGGVLVPVKHRTTPSGYAVMANAAKDGLECNNTGTGIDLYFTDSLGRLYKVTHNAAVGAVAFAAEAAGPPTQFESDFTGAGDAGDGTETSETAIIRLAPKAAITTALTHPAIP